MASKSKTELPVKIKESFPKISLSQYRILCFTAYLGHVPTKWVLDHYDSLFLIRKKRSDDDLEFLRKEKLIVNDCVPHEIYLDLVLSMFESYPEWSLVFEQLGTYHADDKGKYLWKVMKCVHKRDIGTAASLEYPLKYGVWKYFCKIFLNKEHEPFIDILPERKKEEALEYMLYNEFYSGKATVEYVNRIKEIAQGHLISPERMGEYCDGLQFFITGADIPNASPLSNWPLAVTAIKHLIDGKLTEAREVFSSALTKQVGSSKKVFADPILCWFHIICLLKCKTNLSSKAAGKELDEITKDSQYKIWERYSPVRTLVHYYGETSMSTITDVTHYVKGSLKSDTTPVIKSFLYSILKYFEADNDVIEKLGLSPSIDMKYKIVRDEMSPQGVLFSIRRMKSWEATLTGMIQMNNQDQKGKQESEKRIYEEEKRIIYFVDGKRIKDIIEQRRPDPFSKWGGERQLNRHDFIKCNYNSMNRQDIELARALGRTEIGLPDTKLIISFLGESGRLFSGNWEEPPYQEVEIVEDSPYLEIMAAEEGIKVSTNVDILKDSSASKDTVNFSDGRYIIVKTNPLQRDIISNMMKVGTFPFTAVPLLKKTISSLSGILTIKTDLNNYGLIPTVEGTARIALRITPICDKGGYALSITSAPVEDSPFRYEPGQGEELIYDTSGDEARFIHRDLQLEYDNYMLFRDFAEESNLTFRSVTSCEFSADETLLKVLSWAYDHSEQSFVEWPEGRPLRFRGTVDAGDIEIIVKSKTKWFAVEGEIKIDDQEFKLDELLAGMRDRRFDEYIKLGDKDFIRMTETLKKRLETLDNLMNLKVGKQKTVPVYQVGTLAKILGEEGGMHAQMDEEFKGLLNRMQDAYDSVPALPDGLKAELREYQKEGYIWMKRLDAWGAGACLADDMGLGKTVQSLAFILSKASEGPSLVVAPKSVVPNWDIETARFAPSLRVKILNKENNREEIIKSAGPGDLIILTYGVLNTEADALKSREWNVVCLDEAQQIKNQNTKVSSAAMRLNAKSRIILTGTPVQNHLGELWNLFQFINPGMLGTWSDFKSTYLTAEMDSAKKQFLKDQVQPFILRRRKEDVINELPEKMIYEQMVDLSDDELIMYEEMRTFVEDRIKGDDNKRKVRDNVKIKYLAELTNLRLASCSMSLVHDEWMQKSSKTEALMEVLEQIAFDEGNRVLIFSQFTTYLQQIKIEFDKAGLPYLYLDGQTEMEERREIVSSFQNGNCPIFLISLKAGGLGLNLTAANYVILMDPWWNPAIESQAMDRAHRIGQKRNVTVIRMISRHTIEEKILRLHETKQALSDEIMSETGQSGKLSMDDILELVSPFR